jgi:nitrite reductase (NO-forming)
MRDTGLAADPAESAHDALDASDIISALFDVVYVDGNPANPLVGLQTYTIPPGGGATFELTIPDPGLYPFVTHAFAYTELGAVGLLEVT